MKKIEGVFNCPVRLMGLIDDLEGDTSHRPKPTYFLPKGAFFDPNDLGEN